MVPGEKGGGGIIAPIKFRSSSRGFWCWRYSTPYSGVMGFSPLASVQYEACNKRSGVGEEMVKRWEKGMRFLIWRPATMDQKFPKNRKKYQNYFDNLFFSI